MIAFILLAPLVFLSAVMSTFAGAVSMLGAAFAFATGPLVGSLIIVSTASLGALIFILS